MPAPAQAAAMARRKRNYARNYWPFMVPAGLVVAAVIVFPWLFTLYMSVHDWHIGGAHDLRRRWTTITRLLTDERFQWSVVRTLYFTALAVFFPVVLGIAAAVCFQRKFPAARASRAPSSSCR